VSGNGRQSGRVSIAVGCLVGAYCVAGEQLAAMYEGRPELMSPHCRQCQAGPAEACQIWGGLLAAAVIVLQPTAAISESLWPHPCFPTAVLLERGLDYTLPTTAPVCLQPGCVKRAAVVACPVPGCTLLGAGCALHRPLHESAYSASAEVRSFREHHFMRQRCLGGAGLLLVAELLEM
jgi:hypothetical protein